MIGHFMQFVFLDDNVHKTSNSFIWSLQKHAYSNILKISPLKDRKFSDKNSDIFHISAQNIDYGYSL